jgi:RHS repeat-associated protein
MRYALLIALSLFAQIASAYTYTCPAGKECVQMQPTQWCHQIFAASCVSPAASNQCPEVTSSGFVGGRSYEQQTTASIQSAICGGAGYTAGIIIGPAATEYFPGDPSAVSWKYQLWSARMWHPADPPGSNGSIATWQYYAYRNWYCPAGWNSTFEYINGYAVWHCEHTRVSACEGNCPTQNPVRPFAQEKRLTVADFSGGGGLDVVRRYNNQSRYPADPQAASMLGPRWSTNWESRLEPNGASNVRVLRPDGTQIQFSLSGGLWSPWQGETSTLAAVAGAPEGTAAWLFRDRNDRVEAFAADGRLLYVEQRDGSRFDLQYDTNSRLQRVTDRDGRSIDFEWGTIYDGTVARFTRLVGVTTPDGSEITYHYEPAYGRLESVADPTSTRATYLYNEPALSTYTREDKYYTITGILDPSGQRYSTYRYDANGLVTESGLAGGAGINTFTLGSNYVDIVSSEGVERRVFSLIAGAQRVTQITRRACTGCAVLYSSTFGYDANGYRNRITDFNGNTTNITYDSRGRQMLRVEAANTAQQRTVETDWHTEFNQPLERRIKNVQGALISRQTFTLDTDGNVLASSEIDPVSGASRTTTHTYDPDGRILTTNGPRTDISDLTTYTYYPSDDATCASAPTTCPHRKGDLQTVTNAAGQVAQYLRYDGAGRLLESVDPNGVYTTLTYHPRGWLTSRTVGGLTTSITYDAVGQVIKTTQPDGSFVAYTYDAAHRLTGIADNLGNRIDYTLDAAGNRTAEATKDAAGVLKRSLTRVYDQLGRLSQSIDAMGAITQQTYDANGNADLGTDALGRGTDQDVDPLNRLKKSLRDVGGVAANTGYAYDAQDNLTEVTDPNGLKTHYSYNGLNDLTQLSSPDTGTTTYTYDAAGNRLSQTDARGIATNYSYDALNRLTDIAYPDAALNVHFSYDLAAGACAAGEQSAVGRLSGFTDASGNTALCYDPLGRLTRKQQTTAGIALTTTYAYAANGRLAQMTTPGGMIVSYGYDSAGRISGIDTQLPGEPSASAVIGDVHYLPFGPIDQITFGNGRIQTRSYDANYAIDQVSSTGANGLSLDFAVDAVGNLTQVTSGAAGNLLAYDGVDRLTEVKQLNNDLIEAFAYDATGNRTAHTDSAGITPYSYTAGSHRLSAVGTTTRSLDAAGNTTAIGGTTFTYDARNRLSAATVAGQTTQYQYNARGERVSKAGTASTIFVYDEAGHLLGEYASDGSVRAEYVWLGDLPVAIRTTNNTLAYLEPDHLGTPRGVIDPTRDVAIWQWPLLGNAFGDAAPITDPDGDSVAFNLNLRFPGQYFDAETGLHYNYYRDYEAGTGRYVESDPIGLAAGMATYGYVGGNPVNSIDLYGLDGQNWRPPVIPVAPAPAPSSPVRGPISALAVVCASNPIACAVVLCAIPNSTSACDTIYRTPQCDNEDKPCPPCRFSDGTIVPVGTIGYRLDRVPPSKPHYPYPGDHFNLFRVNQNPNNCQCFWQPAGAADGSGGLPPPIGSIPIQPFMN